MRGINYFSNDFCSNAPPMAKITNNLMFTSLFVFLYVLGRLNTKLKPNFDNMVQIK